MKKDFYAADWKDYLPAPFATLTPNTKNFTIKRGNLRAIT